MKKVVINSHGIGLILPELAIDKLIEKGWRVGYAEYDQYGWLIDNMDFEFLLFESGEIWVNPCIEDKVRDHEDLVEVVEQLKEDELKIIEVPDDAEWYIDYDEYGNSEVITEVHRTWR